MNRTSIALAGGSLAALLSQALMAIVMLQFFSPSAAGYFAVVAQVAFFWSTLALAQSPLQFLANAPSRPRQALVAALRASFFRWWLLMPIVIGAMWLSSPTEALLTSLTWAAALAFLQIGWYLAQSWALRSGAACWAASARAVPPFLAVTLAAALSFWRGPTDATSLLTAAATGYAVGWLWLLHGSNTPLLTQGVAIQADDRSNIVRMVHTTMDAVTGVALVLAWHRQHGPEEASYLAVLLRLFGFLPAIVHAAWAQVLLAQSRPSRLSSLGVGLGAGLLTGLMAAVCFAALQIPGLAPGWDGLIPYLAPMALWHGCACLFAALSHRPFQKGKALHYSLATIAFNCIQLAVLIVPLNWPPLVHLWWLAGVCFCGLLAISTWMAK